MTQPDVSPASGRPFARRALAVAAVGSLATALPADAAGAAGAAGAADGADSADGAKTSVRRTRKQRRHAARCRHWHRCAQHRRHTCRHKHRCPHRHHRAPAAPPPDQPPPVDPGFGESPLPTAFARHLASRFGYGITPAMHAQMRAAGSPEAWFEQQLDPAAIPDAEADELETWWPSLSCDAAELWRRDREEIESTWAAMTNYARWCLMRRIVSRRQVHEAITEFWENHLHVPIHDDGVFSYRVPYGRVIRQHALGRFDDLLVAAITHPAMGISLDNNSSTKRAPNENLGRELLELHTVGRGHHTEDDVKNSARILTGYRVRTWNLTWEAWYDTASHWTGPVKVLGFEHPNASPDGRPVAEAYLRYLARHPRTAERLARKLAVRFVSDQPSAALVAELAAVYLAHDTQITPVLRALVASGEFRASVGAKVRTPTDDVVATYRALGVRFARPTSSSSAANALAYVAAELGQLPFDWSRPDGQPETNRAWSSVSRLLASFAMHYSAAGGWWPKVDATYRAPTDWLPAPSVRFDALVDHLSRQLLGRPAPERLVLACSQATLTDPATTITASHGVVRWRFPVLLTTLLDTPEHLHR